MKEVLLHLYYRWIELVCDGSSDFEIDPAERVNPFANAGKKSPAKLQGKDDEMAAIPCGQQLPQLRTSQKGWYYYHFDFLPLRPFFLEQPWFSWYSA